MMWTQSSVVLVTAMYVMVAFLRKSPSTCIVLAKMQKMQMQMRISWCAQRSLNGSPLVSFTDSNRVVIWLSVRVWKMSPKCLISIPYMHIQVDYVLISRNSHFLHWFKLIIHRYFYMLVLKMWVVRPFFFKKMTARPFFSNKKKSWPTLFHAWKMSTRNPRSQFFAWSRVFKIRKSNQFITFVIGPK
jgi:hypothetical protein